MFFTEQPYNTPKTKKLTRKKRKEKKKRLTALSPHGPWAHAIWTFLFLLIAKSVHSAGSLEKYPKIHLFAGSLEKYHGAATVTMIFKMCNFFKIHQVNLYERAVLLKERVEMTHAHEKLEINYLKHHTIRTATQATTEKLTTIT